jgi:hypothetical protein
MSTYTRGGALVNHAHEYDFKVATAHLAVPGLIVAHDTDDAGKVVVAIAWDAADAGAQAGTDTKKLGVAITSTLDREGNSQTGVEVAIIPLESGALARVALYQSNDTITVGDALEISAVDAGYCDKMTAWDTDTAANNYINIVNAHNLIGFAWEAAAANAGGSILARLARGFG